MQATWNWICDWFNFIFGIGQYAYDLDDVRVTEKDAEFKQYLDIIDEDRERRIERYPNQPSVLLCRPQEKEKFEEIIKAEITQGKTRTTKEIVNELKIQPTSYREPENDYNTGIAMGLFNSIDPMTYTPVSVFESTPDPVPLTAEVDDSPSQYGYVGSQEPSQGYDSAGAGGSGTIDSCDGQQSYDCTPNDCGSWTDSTPGDAGNG